MRKNNWIKYVLLVILPLVIDYSINRLMGLGLELNSETIINASMFLLSSWKYICLVYWFWVGRMFANLMENKFLGFILGNTLWLVLVCIYIWQFVFINDESRSLWFAMISQCYMGGFISWSTKIVMLFTNNINGTTITIVAYITMLGIFIIGYVSKLINIMKNGTGHKGDF